MYRKRFLAALLTAVIFFSGMNPMVCSAYEYYDEDEEDSSEYQDDSEDEEDIEDGSAEENGEASDGDDTEDEENTDTDEEVVVDDGSDAVAVSTTVAGSGISQITLNSKIEVLALGDSCSLTSSVTPTTADRSGIQWISNDESVAEVSADGTVRACGTGTAMVIAIDINSGCYGSCSVVVTEKKVSITSVTLAKKKLSLETGDTKTLKATVMPSNASMQKLQWTSSDPEVASVDSYGYITAKKAGKTTITAAAQDGSGEMATCTVTVKKKVVKVKKIKLSEASISLKEGASKTLKATVLPTSADNRKVTWKSSNPSVVSVNSKGKVTAKKAGTAKITVKAKDGSGKKAVCTVTVKRKVTYATSVSLSAKSKTLTVGKAFTLTASVKPTSATNRKVNWYSSNTSVATVSASGKVTAKGAGKTVITASAADGSGKKASCTVTVKKKADNSESVQKVPVITAPSSYAQEGKTITLSADLTGGKWSYVKKSGLVYIYAEGNKCKVTGISKGEIVVKYTVNGKSDSVKLYVIP